MPPNEKITIAVAPWMSEWAKLRGCEDVASLIEQLLTAERAAMRSFLADQNATRSIPVLSRGPQ